MSWEAPPSRSGCRDGHPDRRIPGYDAELGMVPARTSAWFGAVILAAASGAIWIWLPGARPWLLAVLGSWWLVTALVQLALGHRGTCALRRTMRWFVGPAGALVDPFDESD
jgi:hypothetical protein